MLFSSGYAYLDDWQFVVNTNNIIAYACGWHHVETFVEAKILGAKISNVLSHRAMFTCSNNWYCLYLYQIQCFHGPMSVLTGELFQTLILWYLDNELSVVIESILFSLTLLCINYWGCSKFTNKSKTKVHSSYLLLWYRAVFSILLNAVTF